MLLKMHPFPPNLPRTYIQFKPELYLQKITTKERMFRVNSLPITLSEAAYITAAEYEFDHIKLSEVSC